MVEEYVKKISHGLNGEDWGIRINKAKGPVPRVFILPDKNNPVYMLGNKFSGGGFTFHVSLIDDFEIKKHIKIARKICDKNELQINQDYLLAANTENPSIHERIDYILDHCFSPSYVQENNLSSSVILAGQNIDSNKEIITGKDHYQSKRYVEVFQDFKVVLSFSPRTGTYYLSILFFNFYLHRGQDYLSNPITNFFEHEYHLNYLNAVKKHDIDFRETQGAAMDPEASYNIQSFSVTFNCFNVAGTPLDLFTKSARSQKRLVNKLLRYLYLLHGNDLNGKGSEELVENIVEIPKMLPDAIHKSKNSYYFGFRLYSLPLYDIEIGFTEELAWDDDFNEFNVTRLHAIVKPFKPDHPEERGGYYHPLIYEWEK